MVFDGNYHARIYSVAGDTFCSTVLYYDHWITEAEATASVTPHQWTTGDYIRRTPQSIQSWFTDSAKYYPNLCNGRPYQELDLGINLFVSLTVVFICNGCKQLLLTVLHSCQWLTYSSAFSTTPPPPLGFCFYSQKTGGQKEIPR